MTGYFREGLDARFMIVPILIREDVRVDVRIPKDLTEAEARKISAVVMALAGPPVPSAEDGE